MSTTSDICLQPTFLQRQFGPQPTARQIVFDLGFGILLPLICLWFDPIVFRSSMMEPMLGRYSICSQTAIGLGFASLIFWLSFRRFPALLAGFLTGGFLFALGLGVLLFPLSVFGLPFFGLCLLGFSPVVTAFVFWRYAVRAYRQAKENTSQSKLQYMVLVTLGLIVMCIGPWAAQGYVFHQIAVGMDLVLSSNPEDVASGVTILKPFGKMADFDRIVKAYEAEQDKDRQQRLGDLYKDLKGQDIEIRLAILND